MGRILPRSVFRILGLTIPQSESVCTVFTYGFRLYFIVALATVAGSIALQFMKDPGQRKTLLNTLIGLNLVALLPLVSMLVLSTVKAPSFFFNNLLMLLLVSITSPAPYLYMAKVFGPSAQEGLLVGTTLLPLLTALPMVFTYAIWHCENCGSSCD
jgi:hypothetical protein